MCIRDSLRREAAQPDEVEIYMCGVEDGFRGQGWGEWMLWKSLSEVPIGRTVFADCLPGSIQMKSLLRKLGFVGSDVRSSDKPRQLPQRFVGSASPRVEPAFACPKDLATECFPRRYSESH